MTENLSNNYSTAIDEAGDIDSSQTTFDVLSVAGAPAVNFRIKVENELMLVTGIASNTFTVTRGIEGTTATAHDDGTLVTHVVTAGGLDQVISEAVVDMPYQQPDIARYNSTFSGSSTSLVLTMPSAPAIGESLVLSLSSASRAPNSGPTQTNVTWTQRYASSGNSQHIVIYTGVAAASAGTSITLGFASTGDQQGEVYVVVGAPQFTSVTAAATTTGASGTVVTVGTNIARGTYFTGVGGAPIASSYSFMSQSHRPLVGTGGRLHSILCRSNVESTLWHTIQVSSAAYFQGLFTLS